MEGDAAANTSFRGYIPSKRRYFYGLRLHLVVTGAGEPVEFALAAGSEADIAMFKELNWHLPEGSIIYADKVHAEYDHEDLLEEVGLHLKAQRKKNSERPLPAWEEFLGKSIRQYIETVFSRLPTPARLTTRFATPTGVAQEIRSLNCLEEVFSETARSYSGERGPTH